MEFQYKSEDKITIKTDGHVEIDLYKGVNDFYLYVDGMEFYRPTESLDSLFVFVKEGIYSLRDIWREAEHQFDGIIEEVKREQDQYNDDVRFDYNWATRM